MMKERDPRGQGEYEASPACATPIAELFPHLATPIDWDFLDEIEVPDDSVWDTMFKKEGRFLYFITQLAFPELTDSRELEQKSIDVSELIKNSRFSPAIRPGCVGDRLLVNWRLYCLLEVLGVADRLFFEELITEAQDFAHYRHQLSELVVPVMRNLNLATGKLAQGLAEQWVTELLEKDLISSEAELLDLLRNGVRVEGIERVLGQWQRPRKPVVTNQLVRTFLNQNYPLELQFSRIRVAKIVGSPDYVYSDEYGVNEYTEAEFRAKMAGQDLDEFEKNWWLAHVGSDDRWVKVPVFNFGSAIPELADILYQHLDYLPKLARSFQEAIYVLGVMGHEFIHRLQFSDPALLAEYASIAQATWGESTRWQGYPSRYVATYGLNPEVDDQLVLKEDMADSVQIYLINEAYLRQRFPERHQFIAQHFPHLVPNSATITILNAQYVTM